MASVEDCDAASGRQTARPKGRALLPLDGVDNPHRTTRSGCGYLLAGNQNRSGAIGQYQRRLVLRLCRKCLADISHVLSVEQVEHHVPRQPLDVLDMGIGMLSLTERQIGAGDGHRPERLAQ